MGDAGEDAAQGIADGINSWNNWMGHYAPFGFIPDVARRKAQGETISDGEVLTSFGKALATQAGGMIKTFGTVSSTGYQIRTGPKLSDFPGVGDSTGDGAGSGSGGGSDGDGDGSDGSDGSGEGDEGDTGGSDGSNGGDGGGPDGGDGSGEGEGDEGDTGGDGDGSGGSTLATTTPPAQNNEKFENPSITPLVLDLDGDGVELIALDDSQAYFDLNENGFAEKTAWVGSDDGLLAYDRNGDDIICRSSDLI